MAALELMIGLCTLACSPGGDVGGDRGDVIGILDDHSGQVGVPMVGQAEKGPFITGTPVEIALLESDLAPTGVDYKAFIAVSYTHLRAHETLR